MSHQPLKIRLFTGFLMIIALLLSATLLSCVPESRWQTAGVSPDTKAEEYFSKIDGSGTFPTKFLEFELCNVLEGDEALLLMTNIIGTGFNLQNTYIAAYRSCEEELFFWIAELGNEEEALLLLERIDKRIDESTLFSDTERFLCPVSGELVYTTFTGGEVPTEHNYYFANQKQVYWVSLRGENRQEFPQELIKLMSSQ